jgi:hypothetical protein
MTNLLGLMQPIISYVLKNQYKKLILVHYIKIRQYYIHIHTVILLNEK